MRETTILIALLLATPMALAQEEEPTVNDSDYNTTVPEDDDAYLDEAEAETQTGNGTTEEPTVSDGDFDTSLPADDQSYLDEAEQEVTAADGADDTASGDAGGSDTPGPAPLLLVAGAALAALAWRRRG